MTTHLEALEVTLAADPVLAKPEHASTVQLTRTVAETLDRQTRSGTLQTRTLAAYVSLLTSLRRIVRDAKADGPAPTRSASRLAQLRQDSTKGAAK
jgi:hypothetical protein